MPYVNVSLDSSAEIPTTYSNVVSIFAANDEVQIDFGFINLSLVATTVMSTEDEDRDIEVPGQVLHRIVMTDANARKLFMALEQTLNKNQIRHDDQLLSASSEEE